MTWRWQVVTGQDHIGALASPWAMICEIYLDNDGRLTGWSEPNAMPGGDGVADLRGQLVLMLMETVRWKPVRFEDLKVGMTFERALPKDRAEQLLAQIESMVTGAQ